ncbi:hypothetical protein NUW58_g8753 [Xylaria curta]|uniref:Uncharacterized protein n=1 Tax=Xylaria curta TaxID=42375 RepID=A0ACC1N4H1_9PEZI|nr:hypothetical protein NUW58_g8753 [Xylaria curta]
MWVASREYPPLIGRSRRGPNAKLLRSAPNKALGAVQDGGEWGIWHPASGVRTLETIDYPSYDYVRRIDPTIQTTASQPASQPGKKMKPCSSGPAPNDRPFSAELQYTAVYITGRQYGRHSDLPNALLMPLYLGIQCYGPLHTLPLHAPPSPSKRCPS